MQLVQRRVSVLRHLLWSACVRGDLAAVFDYQERERGRMLLALLHAEPSGASRAGVPARAELVKLSARLQACESALAHPATERAGLEFESIGAEESPPGALEAALERYAGSTGRASRRT